MAINLNGLVGVVGNAETAASGSVNGLGPNATAADLTKASLAVQQYSIIANAVSAIINADANAKQAAARGMSR